MLREIPPTFTVRLAAYCLDRLATGQTAEGATSYAPVLELARKHGVEMPITEVVAGVIVGKNVRRAIDSVRRKACQVHLHNDR